VTETKVGKLDKLVTSSWLKADLNWKMKIKSSQLKTHNLLNLLKLVWHQVTAF